MCPIADSSECEFMKMFEPKQKAVQRVEDLVARNRCRAALKWVFLNLWVPPQICCKSAIKN